MYHYLYNRDRGRCQTYVSLRNTNQKSLSLCQLRWSPHMHAATMLLKQADPPANSAPPPSSDDTVKTTMRIYIHSAIDTHAE